MTGPELRAALEEWGVSRRVFSDSLALEGFDIDPPTIGAWKAKVPAMAVRLVERWKAHPEQIPGKKAPHIAENYQRPTRRQHG